MKNLVVIMILILLSINIAFAQGTIILQSGDVTTIHPNLDDAYEAANNGDIIIIPGGYWKGLTMNIEKSITIIGAGYDPRYSVATGVTNYMGQINIAAENVFIEGLNIDSDIKTVNPTGEAGSEIKNIVISRCRFVNMSVSSNDYSVRNLIIKECVFNGVYSSKMMDPQYLETTVSNCFINTVGYLSGLIVENCIVLGDRFEQIGDINFKNNVFINWNGYIRTWSRRINYINNIFVKDEISFSGAEININNLTNVDVNSIFESENEITEALTFDFKFEFIYKDDSPAKNAGDDGTDIGVWGGKYPWKKDAVPMLPYVKEAKVAPATNAQGKLNIKFNVEAQTK